MSDPTPTPTYFLPAPPDRGDDTLSSFLLGVVLTAIESGYGSYWSAFRRARVDGIIEPDDTMALIQGAIDEDSDSGEADDNDGDDDGSDDSDDSHDSADVAFDSYDRSADDSADDGDPVAYLTFPSDEDPDGWAFVAYMAPDGEPADDCPPTVVTEATMRAAFDKLALTPPSELALNARYVREALGCYLTLDAGEVDAELADYILQVACYGTVLCS